MATRDIDNVGTDTDSPTLQRYIMQVTKDTQLTLLMTSIQMGCKAISRAVRKAGIAGLYGLHGTENLSGDQVKKLDVLSDEIFVNVLKESHCCAVLVSEERDDPIIVGEGKVGKYCVAFDPLVSFSPTHTDFAYRLRSGGGGKKCEPSPRFCRSVVYYAR